MLKIFTKIKNFVLRKIRSEEYDRLDEFFFKEQQFRTYNDNKLKNTLALLTTKQREVFRLIPVLIHYNDKSLPGFIKSYKAMRGVSGFALTDDTKRLLKKYFNRSNPRSPKLQCNAVELLALIGSLGSVAQTKASDFDFWICTDFNNFSRQQLQELRQKLDIIERWAKKIADLDIFFFMMDIKHVRSNYFGESGAQSSGTALGKLLKEEFYRSATYVCGKLPYWCIISPAADDEEYMDDVDFLRNYTRFCEDNYLDIGNVHKISKSEFFGAALWQIVKGWRYPFKSILKMALLERYLSLEATSELLCNKLKKSVFDDPSDPKNDPYILLFDSILNFYVERGNEKDLEIIKKCFYIKIGLKGREILSDTPLKSSKNGVKEQYHEMLRGYFSFFNQDIQAYRRLETFDDWPVREINHFIHDIDNALLNMYKRIIKVVKIGEDVIISDTDLTIIGRKIQSIFRRLPNKIPLIAALHSAGNIGSITLHQEQRDKWDVYFGTKRVLTPVLDPQSAIYSSKDIFDIIGWVVLNEYYKSGVYLFVRSNYYNHSSGELKSIMEKLRDSFLPVDISSIPAKELLQKNELKKLYVIANYLKYTSSVIDNIRIFYLNSWGEFFYKKFEGVTPAISFFNSTYIDRTFNYDLFSKDLEVYIPKNVVGRQNSANQRLKKTLARLGESFRQKYNDEEYCRFITIVDEKRAIFYLSDHQLKVSYFGSRQNMYSFFEMPTYKRRVVTVIDDYAALGHLKIMFARARYGQIDIMLMPLPGAKTDVMVIDEVGNMNHCATKDNNVLYYYLSHLKRFIKSTVISIVHNETGSPVYGRSDIQIRFSKVSFQDNKYYLLDSTKAANKEIAALKLHPHQLKMEKGINKAGEDGYIISLEDEVLDDSEYPDILNEVMKRIKRLRSSGKSYDVFITELSLDTSFKKKFCPHFSSTAHFLIYKKILESKLNL